MPPVVFHDNSRIMRNLSKTEVVHKMKESGMIPVFNHPELEVCKSIVKACYDGGLRVFEFTNRSSSAYDVFVELIQYVRLEMPDMIMGVGSIIDPETTTKFILAGAEFIVSPAMIPEMAEICNQEEILWAPGCGTVTEIVMAQNNGADIAKLFPGEQVGGPGFVKSVLGPMPWSLLMPTGGVSPEKENLTNWFNAGVCCVGMGSKLFPKEWISNGEYDSITNLVKNTLMIIEDIRTA